MAFSYNHKGDKVKNIILLLFLSIVCFRVSAATNCGTSSIESINSCTVEDRIHNLISRMYPIYVAVSEGEYTGEAYTFAFEAYDSNFPKSLYDRLLMSPKPTLGEFQAELVVWKSEMVDAINWKIRVDAQRDDKIRKKMEKCGYLDPNPAVLLNKIHDNKDTIKLTCLESKQIEVDSDIAASASKKASIVAAMARLKAADCSSLVNSILQDICVIIKK